MLSLVNSNLAGAVPTVSWLQVVESETATSHVTGSLPILEKSRCPHSGIGRNLADRGLFFALRLGVERRVTAMLRSCVKNILGRARLHKLRKEEASD